VGSTFFAAGKNDDGQLGDRTLPDASAGVVEIPNALPDDVVEISAGGEHACALALGGAVHCWGLGDSGQTGPGASVDRPRALDGVYRTVDCGIDHTCAIDETNVVHCWGLNDRLQCGHEGASTGAPMAVPLPTAAATPQRVSAGFGHTCVLDAEGAVYCWGANEAAQLGTLGGPSTANPTLITMPSAQEVVISLSAGGVHTCAITSRRNVVCWGDNTSYQSSRDSMAAPIVPVVHSSF
jgi:alpha-tubulin suppressor-like RCC1 family protein